MGYIQNFSSLPPHPLLQESVQQYYVMEYMPEGSDTGGQCILPSGNPQVLYVWGSDLYTIINGATKRLTGGIAFGQSLKTLKICFASAAQVYGIVFTPQGFTKLISKGINGLFETMATTIECEIGHAFKNLRSWFDSLNTPPSLQVFKETSDAFLLRRAADSLSQPTWLPPVIGKMWATCGCVKIDRLCDIANISDRQLEMKFTEWVGCKPKQYKRIVRFVKFLEKCRTTTCDDELSTVAIDCGFYDQAHLCREVKIITGGSPTSYLKKSVRVFNWGFWSEPI